MTEREALRACRRLRKGRALGTVGALACGTISSLAIPAFAYQPFDGTHAAISEPGQLEIELGPVGRLQQGSERFLVGPATVLNSHERQWSGVRDNRNVCELPVALHLTQHD
jgi:hypothetical protein